MSRKYIVLILASVFVLFFAYMGGPVILHTEVPKGNNTIYKTSANSVPSSYNFFNYNPSVAVKYGLMIDKNYSSSALYPSGINQSQFQKNLDNYGSEDCAHFVSEALIAGGLTALSNNPPGDNLQGYDGGKFVGSYGIVGVYRLVSYLMGYVPPVFSTNSTAETILEYQPIPASFTGSPLVSVHYVLNESILPSYYLSPGDIVVDGGVGGGHIMLYIGNGTVCQTDPDYMWQYLPGEDYNISFFGLDTLNGQNVTAMYIHIPTFSSIHSVRISAIYNNSVINDSSVLPKNSRVSLIGSFPNGVGIGNYSYKWTDNGKVISSKQNFTYQLENGRNQISVAASGSNGTAYDNFTVNSGSSGAGIDNSLILYVGVGIAVVIGAAIVIMFRRRSG